VSVNGSSANTDTMSTIDDLFSRIQDAIDLSAFSVQVSYDKTTGYPVDIYIDYDDRIADHEWIAKAVAASQCKDSPMNFKVKGKRKRKRKMNCAWVSKGSERRTAKICKRARVKSNCPVTCGVKKYCTE
jgi:hypothetical protein